jgi:hypothetical protein
LKENKWEINCSNKNSIKDSTINNNSRNTRNFRQESKKRQGEREITQTVPTKQAARKRNFTIVKNVSSSNQENRK